MINRRQTNQNRSTKTQTDKDLIIGQHRRSRRTHIFSPHLKKRSLVSILLILVSCAVLVFSSVNLISYSMDYYESKQGSSDLRELYYAEEKETVPPTDIPSPSASPTPVPTIDENIILEPVRYPNNPFGIINSRFQKIRRQNSDIIGWLTIENLLDEAVVQRDNDYYLTRDYRGYHNVNGALFLEEICELETRPYTLSIYGHNMKTGAMFGSLRNYENKSYYEKNPFITFDTMYENGRYVIFSVATISLNQNDWRYFNFAKIHSSVIEYRQEEIKTLRTQSIYRNSLEVVPQDQLLLLVTCVDDDNERRVIAARRIREDESESDLKRIIEHSIKK